MVLDLVLLTILGGYTASFVCVVVERGADGKRPDGRSQCVCGEPIPMYRNIPVVTWLTQGGRAHCCGARIPAWYLVAEAGTALAGLVGGLVAGWPGGLVGIALASVAIWVWHRRG